MKSFFFILSMISLIGTQSLAASYRRLVNFEWDPIEGATTYDVELTPKVEDAANTIDEPSVPKSELKKFAFKSSKPSWNGKIIPGKYMMRLRSLDYRGVPGDWSPPSEFNVGLDTVPAKSPISDAQINSKEEVEHLVNFEWQAVGDAKAYNFELTSEDGSFNKSEAVAGTNIQLKIPVATNYSWKISAVNKNDIPSEAITLNKFSVIGGKLQEPKIEKPMTRFVREISWSKPSYAKTFDVTLLKFNSKNRKWEKFQAYENVTNESLPFEATWPGGKYRMALKAKGNMRGPSQLVKESFEVINGDRSPASEYTALVRTSIDRMNGWFGIASYLVTEITYSGNNPENNSVVSYKARGGTGRIGAGWMSPATAWGFLAIADLSGYIFNGKTSTYASAELNAIYRQYVGNRAELRVQAGGYFKELPETIGDIATLGTASNAQSNDTKISAAGPHLGAEYWYSLTPKLGVQANLHFYYSAIKLSTPNGQNIQPTISTQMGFLGSYRFTPTFTGLAGYARREEKMAYKCQDTTFCTDSETNKSSIVGDYLNFFAEWSF